MIVVFLVYPASSDLWGLDFFLIHRLVYYILDTDFQDNYVDNCFVHCNSYCCSCIRLDYNLDLDYDLDFDNYLVLDDFELDIEFGFQNLNFENWHSWRASDSCIHLVIVLVDIFGSKVDNNLG